MARAGKNHVPLLLNTNLFFLHLERRWADFDYSGSGSKSSSSKDQSSGSKGPSKDSTPSSKSSRSNSKT